MAPETPEKSGYAPAAKRKVTLFTLEDIKELGEFFYRLFERSPIKYLVWLAAVAAAFDIIEKLYHFGVWLGMIKR